MSNISQKQITYLFVDGANFRKYYDETTQRWFEEEVEFDFGYIKATFGAEKAFYYDCVDDIKNDTETDEEFEARVAAQEKKLNKIREVEGCHVFLGSLRRAKKRKNRGQKEVDVMLAVQMMEHAFRGNMDKAVLFSGDLDFRPLVESLVRLGLFIQVVADQKHFSSDLLYSADKHTKLNFKDYYDWTLKNFKIKNRLEITVLDFFPENAQKDGFDCMKTGSCNSGEVRLYKKRSSKGLRLYSKIISPSKNYAYALDPSDEILFTINPNLETKMFNKLDLYFELMHGKIDWK
ncbi:hypothetical protein BH10ACI1_BH10ACI1_34940 [soil metagenome]